MCIDYRKLNYITIKDSYALPFIEKLLASVKGATIFSLPLIFCWISPNSYATSSGTQQLETQLNNAPKELKAYIQKLQQEKQDQEKLMRQQELKEMIELVRVFYPEHARFKRSDFQCDWSVKQTVDWFETGEGYKLRLGDQVTTDNYLNNRIKSYGTIPATVKDWDSQVWERGKFLYQLFHHPANPAVSGELWGTVQTNQVPGGTSNKGVPPVAPSFVTNPILPTTLISTIPSTVPPSHNRWF